MRRDLRRAVRALWRTKGFAALVIACFAVGFGINAAMLGVANALLFRGPGGVRDASHVFRADLHFVFPGGAHPPQLGHGEFGMADYSVLRAEATRLQGLAAYARGELAAGRGPGARPASVMFATASLFSLLGVQPRAGRFFRIPEEGPSGAANVAVISDAMWHQRFGGSRRALGRALRIGASVYTIVGVAPRNFTGLDFRRTDVWLPTGAAVRERFGGDIAAFRRSRWLQLLARKRKGIANRLAETDASGVLQAAYAREFGTRLGAVLRVGLSPITGTRRALSRDQELSLWLAGMSVVVLLIACGNAANLLLLRAVGRRREVAIRRALGSGPWRLARELSLEAGVLAAIGSALGICFAWWISAVMQRSILPSLRATGGVVDLRIVVIATMIGVVAAVTCSVAPTILAMRMDVVAGLKGGAADGGLGHLRVGTGLLVAQVALTTVLLVSAGLFERSFESLRSIDLGIDAQHLVVARVDLRAAGYSAANVDAIMDRVAHRVRMLPGVDAASLATTVPFVNDISWPNFAVRGRRMPIYHGDRLPLLHIDRVSRGYFETAGIGLLRGRGFTDLDAEHTGTVAIINATMARTLWPHEDAVGQCVEIVGWETQARGVPAPCAAIVGVVRDSRTMKITEGAKLQYFAPLSATDSGSFPPMLLVRTADAPDRVLGSIRRVIRQAAPALPYADVRPLTAILEPQLHPWRLGTTVFGAFGAVALVLALAGAYGVYSYRAAQRTRELGIRSALGARHADMVRLLLGGALRAGSAGVLLGSIAALAVARALHSLLRATLQTDSIVFAGAAGVLLATMAATYLPARAAARVDPSLPLRSD